jgi:hypothetical protein
MPDTTMSSGMPQVDAQRPKLANQTLACGSGSLTNQPSVDMNTTAE